jgi:uncharacterized phage protein (TIGR02220 family)
MNTQQFLKLFSTKKDALTALDLLIQQDNLFNLTQDEPQYAEWQDIRDEIVSFEDVDLATRVLDYFNEVNNTKYSNKEKIKAIIRQMPKVTFEQFQSVILHKAQTWGTDPKMRQYIRPATLFGSQQKFINYLDDAYNYWIEQSRSQSEVSGFGR